MKWIKVFAVFIVLHLIGWFGAHWYKASHPETVLLVADASLDLRPEFPAMQRWIENFAQDSRYRQVIVGTDRALIGDLSEIKSFDSIFSVSFGRSDANSLKKYESEQADKRIFLSDGTFDPAGWTLVRFP